MLIIYIFNVAIYIFRGFGLGQGNVGETVQNVKDKAENEASSAAETMNSAASGNFIIDGHHFIINYSDFCFP